MTDNRKSIHIIRVLFSLICLLLVQGCHVLTDSDKSYEAQSLYNQDSGIIAAADDNQLSKQQQKLYRRDAESMALRYINKKDAKQTQIPESLIRSLYNGLIHIVTSGQPGINQLTGEYTVHVHQDNLPREILVFTDSIAVWLDAWEQGKTKTGNPQIDKLVQRFNLTLVDYSKLIHSLPTTMATLRSSQAINTYAISGLFEQQDDVDHAKPNATVGDGSDIRVLFFDDHLYFTFEFGFGDCMADCTNRHLWKYNVYHDGSVEFIKEEGALLPD